MAQTTGSPARPILGFRPPKPTFTTFGGVVVAEPISEPRLAALEIDKCFCGSGDFAIDDVSDSADVRVDQRLPRRPQTRSAIESFETPARICGIGSGAWFSPSSVLSTSKQWRLCSVAADTSFVFFSQSRSEIPSTVGGSASNHACFAVSSACVAARRAYDS